MCPQVKPSRLASAGPCKPRSIWDDVSEHDIRLWLSMSPTDRFVFFVQACADNRRYHQQRAEVLSFSRKQDPLSFSQGECSGNKTEEVA